MDKHTSLNKNKYVDFWRFIMYWSGRLVFKVVWSLCALTNTSCALAYKETDMVRFDIPTTMKDLKIAGYSNQLLFVGLENKE